MFKKQILIAAFAILSISAFAQETTFGVKAGVNFSSIGGDDTEEIDGRTGFHVGGLAEIMFTDQFGIQPELLYSMQGATSEDTPSGISIKEELKLDYLTLPVLAKYKFTPGWNLHLGPQIGFLLNAKNESEVFYEGETESESEDLKDYVSSIDFGLSGGFGYELDMGVFFDARYYLGLSDINDDNEELDSDYSVHNNVIQLSVGYKF